MYFKHDQQDKIYKQEWVCMEKYPLTAVTHRQYPRWLPKVSFDSFMWVLFLLICFVICSVRMKPPLSPVSTWNTGREIISERNRRRSARPRPSAWRYLKLRSWTHFSLGFSSQWNQILCQIFSIPSRRHCNYWSVIKDVMYSLLHLNLFCRNFSTRKMEFQHDLTVPTASMLFYLYNSLSVFDYKCSICT